MREKLCWTAAVVLAIAGTIVLVRALNPAVPDWAADRLRGDTVPSPLIFMVAGLLLAAVPALVLLVWRRSALASAAGVLGVAAALLAGHPLASATADRIAAIGVESTIDEHPVAGSGNYLPIGPGANAHQAWARAETFSVPLLVPGRNLVVLLDGEQGVTVLDAMTGQTRWHWRATNTGSFEFAPSAAVDAEGGRLAVVETKVVVVLDLATGRTLRRIALPGDWWLIAHSGQKGPVLTGSYVLLSAPMGNDTSRVVALDLGSGELSEVDRGPAVKCGYALANPVLPAPDAVLLRYGLDCGAPQVLYLDQRGAVTARVSTPCTGTCLVQNARVYGSTVAFWLRPDTGNWLVVVQPDGRTWRTRDDYADSFTVLPGADPRVIVEHEGHSHEVLDLRDGRVQASGVTIPGILGGVVGATTDGHPVWYRLSGDHAVVLVDAGSLRQIGPAIATGPGDVIGAADGRLLIGPTGRFTSPVQVLI